MGCSSAMIERVKKCSVFGVRCSMFGICIQFTRKHYDYITHFTNNNNNNTKLSFNIQRPRIMVYYGYAWNMQNYWKRDFYCFNIDVESREFPIQKWREKERRSVSVVDRSNMRKRGGRSHNPNYIQNHLKGNKQR